MTSLTAVKCWASMKVRFPTVATRGFSPVANFQWKKIILKESLWDQGRKKVTTNTIQNSTSITYSGFEIKSKTNTFLTGHTSNISDDHGKEFIFSISIPGIHQRFREVKWRTQKKTNRLIYLGLISSVGWNIWYLTLSMSWNCSARMTLSQCLAATMSGTVTIAGWLVWPRCLDTW